MTQVEVHDQPEAHRYVATVDGEQVGLAAYTLDGDVITFTHTEVDDSHAGEGIGSTIITTSLEDVRRRGLRVVPRCPFYEAWFDKHPEAADLLA
ncbi:N-acetyltransferase [Marmoricola endophyticus]|uniref:N-acetyltransferase n=1 Tax=Marmoricola endophyticus TaxID=2040280 RepID=A0A917BNF0_9ACTN|nr:GNAT family N-acetyltransferase [Marmoricola endophyticus]GGF47655.1 N-acetyltransferase [Marmoricola endophyticus]